MRARSFPFSPKTSTALEVGDLIAVPRADGRWGCLQITELLRSGPGSRSTLVAGVLPWIGKERPAPASVLGIAVVKHAMTRIEIFTEGGLEVVANAPVVPHGLEQHHGEIYVGKVHHVWGWRAAIQQVEKIQA